MWSTLLVVFREIIEAGLVIGIVLAVTCGIAKRGLWVMGGVLGGVLGACVVALFADVISNQLQGTGQEIFNASVLLLAVGMLAWHNIWMSKHGRELANSLKQIGQAVVQGTRTPVALSVVVGTAVLREGAEIVLFLHGIFATGRDSLLNMSLGGLIGLLLGGVLSVGMYIGLLKIPTRYLFSVTGIMLSFLAAGMASQAVAFLHQADVVRVGTQTIWNTSAIVDDGSVFGKILHALFGYTAQPTYAQLLVYVSILLGMWVATRSASPTPVHREQSKAV